MEVSGQICTPAALLRRQESPVPITQKASWSLESVKAWLSIPQLVILLTELSWYGTKL
jgi:hypothetical protein